MPFTIATALARLSGSGSDAFLPTFTTDQRVQRLNEVRERLWEFGSWRGLFDTIPLTSVNSVLTVPAMYQRLDGLSAQCVGRIEIKGQYWQFSPGGPGVLDPEKNCLCVAIDLGDVGGTRKYQLTGPDEKNDIRVYTALARKRYVWTTDQATVVYPDSYQGLKLGVQALQWEDVGDTQRYQTVFSEALGVLGGNLSEFESETSLGTIQLDPFVSMGSCYNLV